MPFIIGAAMIGGALIAKSGADKAASAQQTAIDNSQTILAESNIQAAQLVKEGQEAAAHAIMAAGERAAAATLEAAGLARAQIDKFFEIAQADIQEKWEIAEGKIEPFRAQGLVASRELASMMGIADDTGQTTAFDQESLESLPQYQFQFDQGMKAIDRGSRSKLSGGQLKDLQAYGSGLASNVYNDRIAQLLSVDQIGAQAGGQLSNAAMQAGSMLSGAAINAGNQNAGIATNTGNSLSNIALNTGSGLANTSIAGANALAGLQSQYGSDMANLTLGSGSAEADRISSTYNAYGNALSGFAGLYGASGSSNPLMTSSTPSASTSPNYSNAWGTTVRLG